MHRRVRYEVCHEWSMRIRATSCGGEMQTPLFQGSMRLRPRIGKPDKII